MAKPRVRKKTVRPRKAAAKACPCPDEPGTRETEHFAQGLLTRGAAVPEPPPGQDLPPGATHTYEPCATKDGEVPRPGTLRRRRFSLR